MQAGRTTGRESLHEYCEQSTWHAGQAARQLQRVAETLGIALDRPLSFDNPAGVPLPINVLDDQLKFQASVA
jgi:hypothetical protein